MKTKLFFVKRRFLIVLLFALALMFACLIAGATTSVAFADSVTVIVPTNPGDGTSTIVTVTEDKPVIGDVVSFAEHEWYIIGTDSEGVIAPGGCYTLFAKNDEFGSTAFRSGMSNKDISIVYYKDSDLKKAMDNIANGFSSADIANIVHRATLDGIWGDAVTDQLLWPIAWEEEGVNIATSIREFGSAYWTRNGFQDKIRDAFIDYNPDTGEIIDGSGLASPDYSVPIIEAHGDVQAAYKNSTFACAENPGNTHAVRPAAYVKTDAVKKTESKEYKAVIGSQIQFAGYHWYIVGMGDTGPVPGPANTVTLFAASSIKDETGECINSSTDTNYADGELSTVMKGLSDTLGLSAREKALITDRTLTTADGISGNSVTTPFWPLSKDEYEAIYEYDPSFLTDTPGWDYWLRTEYGERGIIYSVKTKTGSISTYYASYSQCWVRPACYLDLSDLFFASGDSGMGASVGAFPSKLEAPLYGSLQNYNFVMHDDTLSLSMVGAATQRGSSLTFHYDAVQGEEHYLSYLVERASAPGIPVYYGQAVNLSNSGSGTVTVPLTDDGNMRTGIPLVNGDYIMRFYTEDRSQDSVIFAGDTVAVGVYVNENKVAISDIKDVNRAAFITGVTITPSSASVENGDQYQFSATVSTDGDEWYDPSITWFVSGENSYGTYISDTGLLTVGIDETSPTITVTAMSVQDNSKRSSVTVSIVYVEPKVAVLFRDSTTLYKDVESAVAAISGFETTEENRARIILLDNIDLTSALTFNTGFVTLNLNDNMLKQTGSDSVISINEGADVVLDDWIGATTTHNYYVADSGLWVFYEGDLPAEAPENATTGTVTGGVVTGGNGSDGGGVYVNGGAFTMTGGTIAGNFTPKKGGGVYVFSGTFTMTGGTISGNTANNGGGVYAQGTFTMNGGTISGNTASYDGGGVYAQGTFTMTGGTISGNTANNGGGVYAQGTFTMTGGTISGNTANNGGGVCVSGTFTMSGGTISDNMAADFVGGVYVLGGTFTMTGGTISGNTASFNGGGVYVRGTFTMSGGTISGNTAPNGGGVYVNNGEFTMNGGTISGNTVSWIGSGVYVYASANYVGKFTMTGGYFGGEIYSDNGTVTISGGYFAEAPQAEYIAADCVSPDISAFGGADFDPDYKEGFPYAVYKTGAKITASADSVSYDGSPVEEGVDFTVEGADGVTLTYSYKVESYDEFTAGLPTNAGEYAVSVYALNGEKQFISMVFDITIAKATYDMSGITFADDRVTYDGGAHSLEISGDLPAGVSVTYAGNDKTNAGEYTVTATFAGDSANYNAIPDMTAMLTIDKAMPVYTTPENLTICVEHTLADVTLPAGWTWEDGTLSVGETGEKQFKAIFTPEDTSNYNTVEESVTVTVVAHTGGTATCTQKAVCSVCGMEYGELAPHVYDQRVTADEYLASAATCTQKATYYYSCVCGEKDTETFEYGELAPHVYDKEVATAEYLASKATCTQRATYYYSCVCGEKGTETFEYGELAEHTAVEIHAVEATCTQSGMTAGSKCSVCGEILVAPEEIAPLGHVDENGDELCDRCGFDMSIPEFTITVTGGTIEGATGSTVIVEEKGSVTVVAGETPEGKEFKGWSIDGGETIVSEEAAYTFTASEDMTLTAVYEDKAAAVTPETPEGLSGGAIAGIVIGSVLGALLIAYGVCALLYKKKIVKGAFFEKIYPFIKD